MLVSGKPDIVATIESEDIELKQRGRHLWAIVQSARLRSW